jgi:hypothetical protein
MGRGQNMLYGGIINGPSDSVILDQLAKISYLKNIIKKDNFAEALKAYQQLINDFDLGISEADNVERAIMEATINPLFINNDDPASAKEKFIKQNRKTLTETLNTVNKLNLAVKDNKTILFLVANATMSFQYLVIQELVESTAVTYHRSYKEKIVDQKSGHCLFTSEKFLEAIPREYYQLRNSLKKEIDINEMLKKNLNKRVINDYIYALKTLQLQLETNQVPSIFLKDKQLTHINIPGVSDSDQSRQKVMEDDSFQVAVCGSYQEDCFQQASHQSYLENTCPKCFKIDNNGAYSMLEEELKSSFESIPIDDYREYSQQLHAQLPEKLLELRQLTDCSSLIQPQKLKQDFTETIHRQISTSSESQIKALQIIAQNNPSLDSLVQKLESNYQESVNSNLNKSLFKEQDQPSANRLEQLIAASVWKSWSDGNLGNNQLQELKQLLSEQLNNYLVR